MPRPETNLAEGMRAYLEQEAARVGLTVTPLSAPVSASPALKSMPAVQPLEITVVGMHPIVVASLGASLESARPLWASAQRQAALARTTVAADKGEDMILIFVGPPGSRDDGEWRSLAMEIERNDLVCRKLVWLPAKAKPLAPEALAAFVSRTLIAKPWLSTAPAQPQELDQLASRDLGLKGWQKILDEQPHDRAAVDYDELVKRLIEAEQP